MLEVLGFIVILIADSELGPVGGEHVAAALISLTGLTRLGLSGTFLRVWLMRCIWFVEEKIKYTGNSLKGVLEVLGFIVTRFTDSRFQPVELEHVAAALISLTGLTRLDLSCTFLRDGLKRGFWFVEERMICFGSSL